MCKTLKTEQPGAVSWILEWILKSLEGVELHQDADEKSCSQAELLSALRFRESRNKIDKSPPPYILIWIRLLGCWPSIVNGGCRFALQARYKFIDQVRILAKSRILWNHGRIFLCPGPGDILYSTFGVNRDLFQESLWTELCSNLRGLKHPGSIQPELCSNLRGLKHPGSIQLGMLEFCPKTMQTSTIAKSCSLLGQSQRFVILEWGLVNPKKIVPGQDED